MNKQNSVAKFFGRVCLVISSTGMISLPQYSFANSGTGMYLNSASSGSNNSAAASAPATTAPQFGFLSTASGDSMKTSAEKSKDGNGKVTMIGGVGLGISMIGMAATCTNVAAAACPYWKMGAIVSGSVMGAGIVAGLLSKKSQAQTSTGGFGSPYSTMTDAQVQAEAQKQYENSTEYQQAKAVIAKSKDGSKVDLSKGTMTLANGTKLTSKDLSSPAAMKAAGLSQADIDGFSNVMAEIDKKAKEKLAAADKDSTYEDGTGTGAIGNGSNSNAGANGEIGVPSPGGDLALAGLNRDPASQVAGMTTSFQGEAIGVAQDDIFGIQTRRYKLEDTKGKFLEQ